MKATDLKQNNLIFYNDKIVTVAGTIGNTIYYKGDAEVYFDSNIGEIYQPFKPIPLTEEWLLKFGFEEKYGYIKNGVHLNTDYSLFIEDEIGFNEWTADCEYVHQLQNLYFALTGEELIIK